ncbi:TPA: hypothetical protein TUW76_001072 [Streptococcus equi subsp. zooepidemicus]|nr:hypothetical protein [Streptococcus equi subsp. zooepidemicus]HEL0689993.1 hypothetical protein [Streptococcus equi subsp. zooepidemicus]HEL0804036.1 hypothetical protein [Streptococcus equi subsp. zooepidemicus]HEL1086696.1 hypothetical protein [Streptococcus equi subsp. zooepidemicus]HEL1145939.1 hypothetical protein [Streptococcus equi subsp. zooepidemicus]
MSYKVTVIFDNMAVDETYCFKKAGDAAKCKAQLEKKYRGQRLYKVEIKKE